MNKQKFLDEVLSSSQCPENFEYIYRKFQKYQKLANETLIEFHRVCEKNNIHYQLAFGSLLGAVRNGGQIPWDYDVDVFVPYEEKKRLIEALEYDLNSKYYFYCPEVNPKCRHMIMRLAPVGYRTEVLHVDVFYLIGLPKKEPQQFAQKIKYYADKRYDRLVKFCDEKKGFKFFLIKLINKCLALNYNSKQCFKEYDRCCLQNPFYGSEFCVSADVSATASPFKSSDLQDTMLFKTNVGELRISRKYDDLLNFCYGNYKEIMPLQDRLDEMMSSYNRLERFAKVKC